MQARFVPLLCSTSIHPMSSADPVESVKRKADVLMADQTGGADGACGGKDTTAAPAPRKARRARKDEVDVGPGPPFKPYMLCGVLCKVPVMCQRYLRYEEHDPNKSGCAAQLHCPKAERPPCPLYQHNACSWGKRCWYPHTLVPVHYDNVRLVLQSPKSHRDRLIDFIKDCGGGVAVVARAHGENRLRQPAFLVTAENDEKARQLEASIIGDSAANTVVGRMWRVDTAFDTLEEAMVWAEKAVLATQSSGEDGQVIKVRVQAFPRKLEEQVAVRISDHARIDAVFKVGVVWGSGQACDLARPRLDVGCCARECLHTFMWHVCKLGIMWVCAPMC